MLKQTINLLYKHGICVQRTYISSVTSITSIKPVTSGKEVENKEYFLKEDPDIFGTLTKPTKDLVKEDQLEEGDAKEEELLQNLQTKKLTTKQYADHIKSFIRKRRIKEAIDVLEVKMIQEDKAKPENYIYNLILGACGRVGYTKKAFSLFNDMKKRGLNPTNGTYTALFNSCANSPWVEDGLSRAKKLKELMKEKGFIPNDTNYNAMIKAFGRCGDINTAFSLVDEMIENNLPIKEETINFLLQSCISDKNAGFRHALLVWRKFHQKNIKPDIYSFNLLLRCVRDCNLGDTDSFKDLLESDIKLLVNPNESAKNAVEVQFWPNLLTPQPYLGNLVKLNEVVKPEDRLMLVGGLSGFLNNMKESDIKPDIKTFTQLLDCIPSTLAAEKLLLSSMKKENVKYDVDFLNMLIKKRSMRFDYENAKDVLNLFRPPKLRPNLITYGVLALSCQNKDETDALIKEMKDSGYRMNIEILGTMLKNACIKMNFVYILELMELTIKEKIKPNKVFIQHLEDLYKRAKHESNHKKNDFFMKGFRLFRMRYKTWLEEVEIDKSEEVHPWEQFRKPTETNVNNYKDPAVHFKPRVTSKFKQKTGSLQRIS